MIQIDKLSIVYDKNKGERVVDSITLSVDEGEIIAVIGSSGCGKSSLLKAIAGVIPKYDGTIKIDGVLIDNKKNLVGYIPQGYGLLPWKTVLENCLLPLKIRKINVDPEKLKFIDKLMVSLNIETLTKRYPATLSGGQKQRVSLVRGLSIQPQILLMDEPFSSLDAIMKDEAAETFLKVWNENRYSTIIVTHSIDEAIYLGKRIVIMEGNPGRIKEIYENPLYGNTKYKEMEKYKEVYHHIKEMIRGGDSN